MAACWHLTTAFILLLGVPERSGVEPYLERAQQTAEERLIMRVHLAGLGKDLLFVYLTSFVSGKTTICYMFFQLSMV